LKTRKFRDADDSTTFSRFVLAVLVRLFGRSREQRRLKILVEHVDFSMWVQANFPKATFYRTREKLWKRMQNTATEVGCGWDCYEFGVAHGYLTNIWLQAPSGYIRSWNGFDRFSGLPTNWRELDKGHFNNEGKPPEIKDQRISWHVGDVEETLPFVKLTTNPKIIFFDLDLYDPTLFVWTIFKDTLISNDIIYFDEAFDCDERKVLIEEVLPKLKANLLGYTPYALALQVV